MPSDTDGDRVVNAKKTNFLFRAGAKETTREEVARSIVRRGGCKHITACHLCPGDLKGSQGKGGCVGWGKIVSVAKEWLEKNAPTEDEKPGGSTPSQYALPEEATELQDLIEYRDMNFSLGNIFKAVYRLGLCGHSDKERDLRKILFFAERELNRVTGENNSHYTT